jgi:hypothetical protein
MSMSTTGAQANGLAARQADDRAGGQSQYGRACFRAVVREATELQRKGQREQADALCAAFERGYGGEAR